MQLGQPLHLDVQLDVRCSVVERHDGLPRDHGVAQLHVGDEPGDLEEAEPAEHRRPADGYPRHPQGAPGGAERHVVHSHDLAAGDVHHLLVQDVLPQEQLAGPQLRLFLGQLALEDEVRSFHAQDLGPVDEDQAALAEHRATRPHPDLGYERVGGTHIGRHVAQRSHIPVGGVEHRVTKDVTQIEDVGDGCSRGRHGHTSEVRRNLLSVAHATRARPFGAELFV